jgi:hypothetical protein
MIGTVFDRTNLPPDLWVHRAWVPKEGSARGGRSIVYVTERRGRLIGGTLAVLGFLVILVSGAVQAPVALIAVGLVISLIGAMYAASGRSGFYEVAGDGSLGEFLGRTKPRLDSMRGMRAR